MRGGGVGRGWVEGVGDGEGLVAPHEGGPHQQDIDPMLAEGFSQQGQCWFWIMSQFKVRWFKVIIRPKFQTQPLLLIGVQPLESKPQPNND